MIRFAAVILTFASLAAIARAQDDQNQPAPDAITAQTGMTVEPLPPTEHFVPLAADSKWFHGGLLLLRPEATVTGSHICLKNICRWSASDAALFQPYADLTIAQFTAGRLYARVSTDNVRNTLRDAGLNLAQICLGGSTFCNVNRPDAATEDRENLEEWITSHQAVPAAATESPSAPAAPMAAPRLSLRPVRTLKELLSADLAARLSVDRNDLEMSFNSTDDNVLNLSEPFYQFQITPRHASSLGQVSWEVEVVAGGERHKALISGIGRLWQNRAVLNNPIAFRQVIRDRDVDEKRILVENLTDEPLITKSQAVGQSAARELKPGMILTAAMVDPVLLCRPGQLITVNVIRGTIKITSVAKAVEGGSFGQTIRCRNDIDPSKNFEVMLTGPQEGTVTSFPDDGPSARIAARAN